MEEGSRHLQEWISDVGGNMLQRPKTRKAENLTYGGS
jgi:hypothetical protein